MFSAFSRSAEWEVSRWGGREMRSLVTSAAISRTVNASRRVGSDKEEAVVEFDVVADLSLNNRRVL